MRAPSILAVLALGACAPAAPTPGPEPIAPENNQCRASDYQYLVGRNRSEIPAQPAGATWRILCDTCAATMDYNPRRLNIVHDTETGVVEQVNCG